MFGILSDPDKNSLKSYFTFPFVKKIENEIQNRLEWLGNNFFNSQDDQNRLYQLGF